MNTSRAKWKKEYFFYIIELSSNIYSIFVCTCINGNIFQSRSANLRGILRKCWYSSCACLIAADVSLLTRPSLYVEVTIVVFSFSEIVMKSLVRKTFEWVSQCQVTKSVRDKSAPCTKHTYHNNRTRLYTSTSIRVRLDLSLYMHMLLVKTAQAFLSKESIKLSVYLN